MSGQANAGKALTVSVEGTTFARIPIRTRVVMPGDDLDAFILEYAKDAVQPGDLLFVTEKIVAITQGRSYKLDSIKPRKLALFLSKYVTRTPYGIGLGMPETMEMALRELALRRHITREVAINHCNNPSLFDDEDARRRSMMGPPR